MSIRRRLGYTIVGAIVPLVVLILGYIAYVWIGTTTGIARTTGTIAGLGLHAPVQILRDDRDIPHIRATSAHDAAYAEGYVTGSDRLFQIDVTRRKMLGRLAELFGDSATATDEDARVVDVRGIVATEYAHLTPAERETLQAFADGVNAAAVREPKPPEYKIIFQSFRPWTPQDSLAVGFATVLELTDSWDNVIARDTVEQEMGKPATGALYSLTDPAYDTPTMGGRPVALAPLPPLPYASLPMAPPEASPSPKVSLIDGSLRDSLGSNEWTAGASRTSSGRALLANDPHLPRTMPGIWYLLDVAYPGVHVAGAALAGVPGVILGHNDHLAWGATDARAVSPRVYNESFMTLESKRYHAGSRILDATVRHEVFKPRLAADVTRDYLTTRHGFVVEATGDTRHAVQWEPASDVRSPISAFLALDAATSIEDGLHALATYPGPAENFALAQTDGRAAYWLAGDVNADPAWGLRTIDGATTDPSPLTFIPFALLPHVAPSRTSIAVNANNLPYPAGYPYRVSAAFGAPYRAAEITAQLHAHPIGVEPSRAIQADTLSLGERELAHMAVEAVGRSGASTDEDIAPIYAALRRFDGHFDPASQGATIAQRLRVVATYDLFAAHMSSTAFTGYLNDGPAFVTLMRALRERPKGWFPHDDVEAFLVTEVHRTIRDFGGTSATMLAYGNAYRVIARHPFAAVNFKLFDSPPLAGSGGSYAPAVQAIVLGQSFRAVWDVGAWDNGGIDLPFGESGEPGSPWYKAGAEAWQAHTLTPLPFSDAAVARSTRATETLTP